MLKLLDKLVDRMQLFGMQQNEIGKVDGVSLATLRPQQKQLFQQTIQEALGLIQKHDPRRYARITQHFKWICSAPLKKGMAAMFIPSTQSCIIDLTWVPGADNNLMAAFYAILLVHESTHAVVESRGIQYSGENRRRIERLCFREQNRFAARLAMADPAKYPLRILRIEFDEKLWTSFYADQITRIWLRLSQLVSGGN